MISNEFVDLKTIASCDVCQQTEWVTHTWAEEHFGSDAEAQFVVAANPNSILKLIVELERLETENANLKKSYQSNQNPTNNEKVCYHLFVADTGGPNDDKVHICTLCGAYNTN